MIPPHLLARLPLLADGAPGDLLLARHPGVSGPPEALNLRRPEWVQAVHTEFLDAGAQALRTNSAQASAAALAAHGLEERCEAVNNSAMALLREAAGARALAMGIVGEMAPGIPGAERERAYAQQIVYLCDTGADFLLLDGFTSTEEVARVLRLVRNAGDAPVLAALQVNGCGRTAAGQPLADEAQRLLDAGCDAIGGVFSQSAAELAPLVEPLLALGAPVAVFLAGADPGMLTPEVYARRLAPLAGMRTAILGGGRHIGPAHVAALARALGKTDPPLSTGDQR